MKDQKAQVPNKNQQVDKDSKLPANKGDLDSRKGEEQEFKGNDVTHNQKETHSKNKKK